MVMCGHVLAGSEPSDDKGLGSELVFFFFLLFWEKRRRRNLRVLLLVGSRPTSTLIPR